MSSGGARNRSGPAPDPTSGRSDRRGYKLTALPAEGYAGDAPEWPLSEEASSAEWSLWQEAWKTPQACAWSMPSESWRIRTVALWVRVRIRCEAADAPAALLGQLHRFADQIGMTTAGLAEMGWAIAKDELAERRQGPDEDEQAAKPKGSSRDRLKVVGGR